MANNSLAIRFTENEYATKSEVAKELKTQLIDSFWKLILEYRSSFSREVPIRTINNSKLTICLCPSVNDLINRAEMSVVNSLNKFSILNYQNNDTRLFKQYSKIDLLKAIASFHDLDVDEAYLRMLINGNVRNIDPKHEVLVAYSKSLDLLENKGNQLFDEDLIAELYTTLSGNLELISLYRNANDDDPKNKVIIDRIYTSAPYHLLDNMMSTLISYVQTGSGSLLTKAATVLFYINYAKPFAKYNEEMSILLAKYVLATNGLDSLAYYLDIEELIANNYMECLKIFTEVQKSDDLTYFVRYFVKNISVFIDKAYAINNQVQAQALKDDYYKEAYEEAHIIKEEEIIIQEKNKENEYRIINEEVVITPTVDEPIIKEEKEEIEEELVVEETKKEEVISTIVEENENKQPDISGLAISYLPPVLDEKALKRLEEDLLESDPELKRGQAKFYARHCTMGKRYTIQQFKKEINCAYETARTSMDGLVELGYYRQEMVKNKKVYTPIKRK